MARSKIILEAGVLFLYTLFGAREVATGWDSANDTAACGSNVEAV